MKTVLLPALLAYLLTLSLTSPTAAAGGLTKDIKSGGTKLTFDSAFNDLLLVGGINTIKIAPGVLIHHKGTLVAPIISGALDTSTARVEIATGGGLKLSKGSQQISVIDLAASITAGQGSVTALVTVNGTFSGRIDLGTFTLPIPTPVIIPKNNKLKVQDVTLKLSADSANALNNAFGVTAFAADQTVGTYDLVIIFAGKPL